MGQQLALALAKLPAFREAAAEPSPPLVPPGWELVSARRTGTHRTVHVRPPGAKRAAVTVAPPSPPPEPPAPLTRDEERALATIETFAEHRDKRAREFLRARQLPLPGTDR